MKKDILYIPLMRKVTANSAKLLCWIPDSIYLKLLFRIRTGRKLNLQNPITYNEKLQWLKIYDRDPKYNQLVDKYEVKEYVANLIGEQYLIKTLGCWKSFDEIDFAGLPDKFVLKCTHDSGGLVICKDKVALDIEEARKKISSCLKKNYYYQNREWVYKDVEPRIIAEEYIEDETSRDLKDYKFFCFNGEVKGLFVASDRPFATKFDFFDADFERLPIQQHYPNSNYEIAKPECFDEMKQIAEKLSQGFKHIRIDLYVVNNKVYFGEMTFFHFSGMERFDPDQVDYEWGKWIEIDRK